MAAKLDKIISALKGKKSEIPLWMLVVPIAGARDWRTHSYNLRKAVLYRFGLYGFRLTGAEYHENSGQYNGANSIAISTASAKAADALILGAGWEEARGCKTEFHIALNEDVELLIFERGDGSLVAYKKVEHGG